MGPEEAARLHASVWDRVAYLARYARIPYRVTSGEMTSVQAHWLQDAIGRLVDRENAGTRGGAPNVRR